MTSHECKYKISLKYKFNCNRLNTNEKRRELTKPPTAKIPTAVCEDEDWSANLIRARYSGEGDIIWTSLLGVWGVLGIGHGT